MMYYVSMIPIPFGLLSISRCFDEQVDPDFLVEEKNETQIISLKN